MCIVELLASCRYEKSQWTECNQETNIRSRVLTLKKGDEGCVPTRTIQRKCKKGTDRETDANRFSLIYFASDQFNL